MEKNKLINSINIELEELHSKLGDDSYNKFINQHGIIKKYNRYVNNKILRILLGNLFLKRVYALVHEKNYY